MKFDRHDAKSEKNLADRGFGFDFAARIFLGRVLTQVDDREDDGEVRVNAIWETDGGGVVLVVIYTDRDDVCWIISARLANRKERALWHA